MLRPQPRWFRSAGARLALRLSTLAAAALFGTACTESCLDYGLPGIVVRVSDVTDGGQISADSATAVATDGSYIESVSEASQYARDGIHLAYERSGTYAVIVTAAGYELWDTAGVRVRMTGCHVVPSQLDARLAPTGT